MKKVVGQVSELEKREIQILFERRNGLNELAKILTADNTELYERLIKDLGETSIKFQKWWNTVCTRKGYAASVSQLALATAALYFSFFKLKKWGKKTAETRRHNCAVLP